MAWPGRERAVGARSSQRTLRTSQKPLRGRFGSSSTGCARAGRGLSYTSMDETKTVFPNAADFAGQRTSPGNRWRTSDGRFAVHLPDPVWQRITQLCRDAACLETGGILVGRYDLAEGVALVEQASGAPPDSRRGLFGFTRGHRGADEWLAELWPHGTYYLGEWHLHPGGPSHPSATDRAALKGIAIDPRYSCSAPLLLVVGGSHRSRQRSWLVWAGDGAAGLLPDP